ncbi:MAG: hypothetical protein R6U10_05920 [Thermoplasmatota archaeon]
MRARARRAWPAPCFLFCGGGGIETCGFKPRAGHSFWYDHGMVRETLREGRLYGHDAAMLRRYSSGSLPEEDVNPVHRLWPERARGAFPGSVPSFIADRVTLPGEEMLVVNATVSGVDDAVDMVRRGSRATVRREITSLEEYNRLARREYVDAVAAAAERAGEAGDCMVCESYARVALPWQDCRPDVVLVVTPGRVSAYDGAAYRDAVSLVQFREAMTDRAVELLQPLGRARLPPVAGDVVGELAELSCWRELLAGLL